ncbi:MAG: 50S ribosomal protein L6, partial [Planctomycetota bacterium]
MSRIGKKPITVPSGVDVAIDGRKVSVSGKQGNLAFEHRPEVSVAFDPDAKEISVSIDEKDIKQKAVLAHWGTTRALIANMVEGVTKHYEKKLEVVGVGYTAQLNGQKLALKVGFANTIEKDVPQGVDVKVDKQMVIITGADKQAVGQFAAEVRAGDDDHLLVDLDVHALRDVFLDGVREADLEGELLA